MFYRQQLNLTYYYLLDSDTQTTDYIVITDSINLNKFPISLKYYYNWVFSIITCGQKNCIQLR